jgi:hypothetical protein
MSSYLFSIDQVLAHNPKGKKPDSDWLSLVWTITDIRTNTSETHQAAFHLGDNIGDNTLLTGPWTSGLIELDDNHIVSVVLVIINLSSLDIQKQAEKATEFATNLTKEIAPLYFEGGSIALAIATVAVSAGAAAAAAALGGASAAFSVLSQETNRIVDKIIGPFLKAIEDFVAGLLGGDPFCDGEVFRATLVLPFPSPPSPADAFDRLKNGEQFSFSHVTGPQENDRCGEAPTTTVTYSLGPGSLRKFLRARVSNPKAEISVRNLKPPVTSIRAFMVQ